jgi:hypothetical protein
MDGTGGVTGLEQRCRELEALNAQLARDLARAASDGAASRPRGAAAAALHVSALERRLEATLAELDEARADLAAARADAADGWGRFHELRGRRAVRWALRIARLLPRRDR